MTRFEYMTRNGKEGIRLGFIQVDIATKYEAYINFLEFMEEIKDQELPPLKRSKRMHAIQLTAKKMGVHRSTIWKHIAFFDYVTPTQQEMALYKNQTRWNLLNSGNNGQ